VSASTSVVITIDRPPNEPKSLNEAEKYICPINIGGFPKTLMTFKGALKRLLSEEAVDLAMQWIPEEGQPFGARYAERKCILYGPITVWVNYFAEAIVELSPMPAVELLDLPDPDGALLASLGSYSERYTRSDFPPGIEQLSNLEVRMFGLAGSSWAAARVLSRRWEIEDSARRMGELMEDQQQYEQAQRERLVAQEQQQAQRASEKQPRDSSETLHEPETQPARASSLEDQQQPSPREPPSVDPASVQSEVQRELAVLELLSSQLRDYENMAHNHYHRLSLHTSRTP
jgi:hypothetical protein